MPFQYLYDLFQQQPSHNRFRYYDLCEGRYKYTDGTDWEDDDGVEPLLPTLGFGRTGTCASEPLGVWRTSCVLDIAYTFNIRLSDVILVALQMDLLVLLDSDVPKNLVEKFQALNSSHHRGIFP